MIDAYKISSRVVIDLKRNFMSIGKQQEGVFSDLPIEILSQILSDACMEPTDSYHQSLVNRKFSRIVQQKLYGHISLTSGQPKAWEQLLGSLRGNAQLRPLVHHLRLESPSGIRWNPPVPESVDMALREILGLHLPSLESLTLKPDKINLSIYEIDPMSPLRYVEVHCLSLEQAATLMLLPCVEKIHITCITNTVERLFSAHAPSASSPLVRTVSRFSTVRDIRIDVGFEPHTLLSPFVTWPRKLKSFHGSMIVVGGLSPISVDRYLVPVRETLEVLSIAANTDEYTVVDGTFIAFEKFKYLKDLNTTASLLFGHSWNVPSAQRAGLYRRLPTTLESLTVFFDNQALAIRTGREDEYLGSETPADYLWITELTILPNLKYLRIEEDLSSQDDAPNFESFQWEPHHIIRDLFAGGAVKFEASLRSYKQHKAAIDAARARMAARREARALAMNQTDFN